MKQTGKLEHIGTKADLNSVLVSLAQLVWRIHNICKIRKSNLDHQKKIWTPSNWVFHLEQQ